ncbi:MAG: tetratricopeptide repeat protein [Salibacteraceae bacterium]
MHAFNELRVDSLENALSGVNDTTKVRLLVEISDEWGKRDPKQAVEHALQGLLLAIETEDSISVFRAYRQLGIANSVAGKYEAAKDTLEHALELSKLLRRPPWVINSLLSIGNVSRKLTDYEGALAYYQEAALLAKQKQLEALEAQSLCNVAVAHADLGNYDKAIEYCLLSIEIDRKLNNQKTLAVTLGNIAIYYAISGDFESGILFLKQAYQINENRGNKEGMAYNLNNMGRMYTDLGNLQKAIECLLRSKELNEKRKDYRMVAYNEVNIGRNYLEMGRTDESIYYARLSLETANFIKTRGDWVTDAYQILAEAHAERKEFDEAFHYLQQYTDLRDTLYTEQTSAKIAEMEGLFNKERQQQEIALLQEREASSKAALEKELAEGQVRRTIMWFSLVALALMIALVITQVVNYRRRNRTRELLAAKAEEAREKEASRQLAEMRLKALRSQMNPHFIFNVINSIQHFIMKSDRKAGYNYLSKFARLIRVILENSQKNTVFLEEELKTLKLYLEIESLRFEDKFDYQIEFGEALNGTNYEIPAMLVQPYVENAIVHGLLNKTEKGRLLIKIDRDESLLHCVVQDNGVGRKKAQEIKKNKLLSHRSVGMSNTSARLEILNLNRNTQTRVDIQDLFDEEGDVSGTRVDLYIPIINE